jgi:hypothetical protein
MLNFYLLNKVWAIWTYSKDYLLTSEWGPRNTSPSSLEVSLQEAVCKKKKKKSKAYPIIGHGGL